MNDLINIGVEMHQTPLSYDKAIVTIAHIETAEMLWLLYTYRTNEENPVGTGAIIWESINCQYIPLLLWEYLLHIHKITEYSER